MPRLAVDRLLEPWTQAVRRHYVGWTSKPGKRISRHGPAANREIAYLAPGTTRDGQALKLTGTCPKRREPLAASLA